MKISQKDLEGLKKKVALGNRIMFHQGLADYHGHVSARIPGTRNFFIKPVLAPLGSISVKDIIEVNIDEYKKTCEQNWAKAGNKREVTKLKVPPRETMIHASIYEARPAVNSVVHTHQPLATAFSVAVLGTDRPHAVGSELRRETNDHAADRNRLYERKHDVSFL